MSGSTESPQGNSGVFRNKRLIVVLVLVAVAGAWLALKSGRSSVGRDLDRQVEKLAPYPGPETVFPSAMDARESIRRGDYASAAEAISTVLNTSKIGPWHFTPFSSFINEVTAPSDDKFLQQLNAWANNGRSPAIAYLTRANYYLNLGWWVRGNGFVASLRSRSADTFRSDMVLARADILQAVKLDPKNPYARYAELRILRNVDGNAAQESAFEDAIAAFPSYYPLYEIRLATLQPKWGGSVPAMYAFVDKYAGSASEGSPLKLLDAQLYADLINVASVSCIGKGGDDRSRCVDAVMARIATRKAVEAAYAALKTYTATDKVAFVDEVGGVLSDMIMPRGGERFAGEFLQLTAAALGSNTQLTGADTSKNTYMIDQMAGLVWYRQGRYDNARTLYKRAVSDLPNTHFPNPESAASARAGIYNNLAETYNHDDDYRNVVVYTEAANRLLGGTGASPGWGGIECEALFRLKLYARAVRTCTTLINNSGELQVYYWRAHTFEALGKTDQALQGYRMIARSESSFRRYSAIEISLIYGRKKEWKEALDALNAYPWLFDTARERDDNLSVAFNNRCYYKMKLGDLEGALVDCTASLKYGNLPDAYSKQQELIRRLKHPEATSS